MSDIKQNSVDAIKQLIGSLEKQGQTCSEIQKANLIVQASLTDFTDGDLSDLGNTIGIAIAEYISDKPGFEKEDFIEGIKHGISLKHGSHG